MDAKEILTNKSFCTLPWTGFELEPNGNIKNCIISTEKLGNIEQQDIESVLLGKKNTSLKEKIMADERRGISSKKIFKDVFLEIGDA